MLTRNLLCGLLSEGHMKFSEPRNGHNTSASSAPVQGQAAPLPSANIANPKKARTFPSHTHQPLVSSHVKTYVRIFKAQLSAGFDT